MNLPKPSTFRYYNNLLCSTAEEVRANSMRQAVEDGVTESNGYRDWTVVCDGSRQLRGHSSLNSIVTAIAANTGKVIDAKISTKYCRCKRRLENEHSRNFTANYGLVVTLSFKFRSLYPISDSLTNLLNIIKFSRTKLAKTAVRLSITHLNFNHFNDLELHGRQITNLNIS